MVSDKWLGQGDGLLRGAWCFRPGRGGAHGVAGDDVSAASHRSVWFRTNGRGFRMAGPDCGPPPVRSGGGSGERGCGCQGTVPSPSKATRKNILIRIGVNVQADDGAGAGADGPPGCSPRLPGDGPVGEARATMLRSRQSMVMLLLLVGWLAAGPVRAEAALEWERLPDGRVVIEIDGRRFAFPPDMPVGQVEFIHGYRQDPIRPLKTAMRFASPA